MKEYAYFPGCSLEKMALSYHRFHDGDHQEAEGKA